MIAIVLFLLADDKSRNVLGSIATLMRLQQAQIRQTVHTDVNAMFQTISSMLHGRRHEYENESEVIQF